MTAREQTYLHGPLIKPIWMANRHITRTGLLQDYALNAVTQVANWSVTVDGWGVFETQRQRYKLEKRTVLAVVEPVKGRLVAESGDWKLLTVKVSGAVTIEMFRCLQLQFGWLHHLPIPCRSQKVGLSMIDAWHTNATYSPNWWTYRSIDGSTRGEMMPSRIPVR